MSGLIRAFPVTSVNNETGAVVLDAADLSLGNVDNTGDSAKPISVATAAALTAKLDDSQATAFMLTVMDDIDAAAARATLGVINPAGTLASTGTMTFPGGLVLKWGATALLALDSPANPVAFATAFPTACFNVVVSPGTDNGAFVGTQYSCGVFGLSAAGFSINNDSTASIFYWQAIGH